jgi:hypothetical protein
VKEGFARSASTKERRFLKPFHKAERESVEKLIRAQGVCPITVISPYNLRKTSEKLPGGHKKLAEELGTLEVLKSSKFLGELHKFMQGEQKAFKNSLSLER